MRAAARVLAVALAAALFAACGDERSAAGTGIYLQVAIPAEPAVDQLRVQARIGGVAVAPPVVRPESATMNPLAQVQSLRLKFDDSLAGEIVELEVDGLWRSERVATGTAAAQLVEGREADAFVVLK